MESDSKSVDRGAKDAQTELADNSPLIRLKSRTNDSNADDAPVVRIISRTRSSGKKVNEIAGSQYKSFSADTFEELDQQIRTYISDGPKVIAHISCYFDGRKHNCMLETTFAAGSKLMIDGDHFEYCGEALINECGEMMIQCY